MPNQLLFNQMILLASVVLIILYLETILDRVEKLNNMIIVQPCQEEVVIGFSNQRED